MVNFNYPTDTFAGEQSRTSLGMGLGLPLNGRTDGRNEPYSGCLVCVSGLIVIMELRDTRKCRIMLQQHPRIGTVSTVALRCVAQADEDRQLEATMMGWGKNLNWPQTLIEWTKSSSVAMRWKQEEDKIRQKVKEGLLRFGVEWSATKWGWL